MEDKQSKEDTTKSRSEGYGKHSVWWLVIIHCRGNRGIRDNLFHLL